MSQRHGARARRFLMFADHALDRRRLAARSLVRSPARGPPRARARAHARQKPPHRRPANYALVHSRSGGGGGGGNPHAPPSNSARPAPAAPSSRLPAHPRTFE